ncbi:hypothetical protein [Natrinema pallidum]|uniref:hypothetical protein n=1 Tax=Natrinema pallidum TaxID=69527 RepID=UPI00373AE851
MVAGYARGENFAREVVQYDLENLTDAAEASIVIGRNPDSGEIEVANLDYYYETDDGVLDEVHRFEPTNGPETASNNPPFRNERRDADGCPVAGRISHHVPVSRRRPANSSPRTSSRYRQPRLAAPGRRLRRVR